MHIPSAKPCRSSIPLLHALSSVLFVLLTSGVSQVLHAADGEIPSASLQLNTIVVTGSRTGHSSFDLPASIDTVSGAQIQVGQWQVNSSESLTRVPGVYVQNRQAYAQDLQVSSRGFGARSQIGVSGIRIIADDIPLTMPDGQGQTGSFDLSSAKRIEVLRGPFSTLYGNHSGGVVQIFTEDGPVRPTLSASYAGGSYDSWRSGLKFGGQAGNVNYLADASRFDTAGYRDHSAARRDQFNGKFRLDLANDAKLTLVTSYLDQPDNQDPLGLTAAQVRQNPRQAIAATTTSNTRRSLTNTQGGLVYEQKISATDTLHLVGYLGTRDNEQFIAIPANAAPVIKGSGGDSVIARDFGGTGLRWTHQAGNVTVTSGLDWDNMKDARTGYENNGGVRGVLRRDEDNIATGSGIFTQMEWKASPQWTLSGGLRASRVSFEVKDHHIKPTVNLDDSGSKRFSATTPVLGGVYHLTPSANLYVNAGKGFETPTFIQTAYRPDGNPGINFDLKPSRSNNFEAGMKALVGEQTRLNIALFSIDVHDEIVIATNSSGRATYQNAGQTQRRGLEVGIDSELARNWTGSLAYTYLDATYRDAFQTCFVTASSSCVQKSVPAGNSLPGVPRSFLYAELVWKTPVIGMTTAVEARYAGRVNIDDFNSQYADSYATVNWRIGYEQQLGSAQFKEFLRIDNLFDKDYIGAVYVNDANGRFYAPAPGRNWIVGASASLAF